MKLRSLVFLAGIVAGLLSNLALSAADPSASVRDGESRFQIPATDDGLPGAGPLRRADWFQKIWSERRSTWTTEVQRDQGAVVLLGDSITQGWWSSESFFPGVKLANRGIGGDTTRGILIRLEEDVLKLNPKGVVLLIGTNDLEEGAEASVIAGNLKLIIDGMKQHRADMPVIVCEVFPSSASMKRPADKIKKLNAAYRDVLQDQPQVTLLETYPLFATAQGDAFPEEFPDLLHPNAAGYARFAAALRPTWETLGLVPAWPDDFKPEPDFVSLFNGKDLSGWGYEGGAPFDGKTEASDRRYAVRNGRLVVTAAPKLRDYRKLWTTQKFPRDFVLKLEFRASPNADSGIYIREPQLQCRDYAIAGPFLRLKNYRALDWNEIVVTVKNGLAHCTCNGEVLIDAMPLPTTGPIGLESDHGQMEYRRIRIKEGSN